MLDLAIRGGHVIDGTGRDRLRADVGIRDGRIVRIGELTTDAAETIDASGKVVTPGFIDLHTHYDAQVFWDGTLSPSPLHGVTTALAGNCGFSIAPLSESPTDTDYLMRMLARVEGMPLDSLRAGVPWNWTSTGEYFEAVDGRLGINAGFMVGHSAIRRVVMGREAARRRATPEEVVAMGRLLSAGLEVGALGFSSSWARAHNDADGRPVPSRCAAGEEILALCSIVGGYEGTSVEFNPPMGPGTDRTAIELMATMSIAAARPVNWNVLMVSVTNLPETEAKLEAGDHARETGGKVVALTIPMNFGMRLSFRSGFMLDALPGWAQAMALPFDDKLALLRDADSRAQLKEKARDPSVGGYLRALADWDTKVIFDVVAPENEQYVGQRVGEIAAELGRDPWDVLCDIAVADELDTSFGTEAPPDTDEDWQARLAVWRDSRAVIGASDAGAHLDLLASFHYTTAVLEQVRTRNLLPLEEAVHLLTDVPARLYGIRNRGRLAEGWWADVVVLDPATVTTQDIRMRRDLPGGASRLYAGAEGIDHVFVNGRPIVREGQLTPELPGVLLRSGHDTATPSLD